MSEKRPLNDNVESTVKRRRNNITLEMKLEILRRSDAGERGVDIGRALGLPTSTVRTICINADKIEESAQSVTPLTASRISRTRSSIMENMERLLAFWIEDQNQRNVPVSMADVQEKAKSLYDDLKKQQGECSQGESFGASRGWFVRFKRRSNLFNNEMSGEITNKFITYMKKIIADGAYSPKQIFNVTETVLYWKRLPQSTYISKEEKTAPGFKASKDYVTLLLGGNAEGDFKFKPLVVYHSETPRALKNRRKEHLPVIWRSNKKSWITSAIFQEWFSLYAIPSWEEYCANENLEFKILLILDNAPGHPITLKDLSENVKVVFLPPNNTSSLQPMDQGAIATFKAYYLHRIFSQIIEETEGDDKPTVREFWRSYNILNGIHNIASSWDEISSKCMNDMWRKIWPECVFEFDEFDDLIPKVQREIVYLAKEVGFEEVEEADVVELLEFHGEELSNEDLMQLERERAKEETQTSETQSFEDAEETDVEMSKEDLLLAEEQDKLEATASQLLSMKRLAKAFQMIEQAMEIFSVDDPNRERSSKVNKSINERINCYRDIYQKKVVEHSLDKLFEVIEKRPEEASIYFKSFLS